MKLFLGEIKICHMDQRIATLLTQIFIATYQEEQDFCL